LGQSVNPYHPNDRLSTSGIVKLLVELDFPAFGTGLALFGYPLVNPFRGSHRPADFIRFWTDVSGPVIRFFEQELTEIELDGLIAVRGDEPI
jgi:hypothetical protein